MFAAPALALLLSTTIQAASTGTVTFNGELTQNTCDVSIEGRGPDATIVLPTVLTGLLQTPGQTAGLQQFAMVLSNCAGPLRYIAAYFEAGPTVDGMTGRLKNTNSTGATNVSLQLLNQMQNSNPIQAGNQNQVANNNYAVITGSTAMVYAVQYYAEGVTTPGVVNSSVVYSLMYK
ncbi:fimbrial protein [Pantoea sp.]|uniref:fimbrial protein n=1 Tax=Pantoea sp. TaxID=69393 RepID=UPI0031E3C2DC